MSIEAMKQALEALQGSGYYDTTQQREWVGLTDEERKQLWDEWENGHVVEATEAKLKDKNGF